MLVKVGTVVVVNPERPVESCCKTSEKTMPMSSFVGVTVVDPLLTAVDLREFPAVVNAEIRLLTWAPMVPSDAV